MNKSMKFLLAALSMLFVQQVQAQTIEGLLTAAQAAYNKQDLAGLQMHARQMKAQGDILAPYADYWIMLLQLSAASNQDVQAFLQRYAEFPFADRVRGEWLKKLGKNREWQTFFAELPNLRRDDVAVNCYTMQGQAHTGTAVDTERLRSLWLVSADLPSNCTLLFDEMFQIGRLTEEDAWARFRLALQDGKISVAKAVSRYISTINAGNVGLIDRVYKNPQQVLERNVISYKTRYGRELNIYAIDRVARTQPALALDIWQANRAAFNAGEQAYVWGRLALHAARRHDPMAAEWWLLADDAVLDNEQKAWRVRTALRAKNWQEVLRSIEALSHAEQQVPAWRYWKARALKEMNQTPQANAIFVPLSLEHHYYGLLANEALGDVMHAPGVAYKPGTEDLKRVEDLPAIQRALALNRLGFRWEARAEWNAVIQDFDDRQLIAAAEIAFRNDWIDVAINTAEKTRLTHDFALRYPTPYRDMMRAHVRENALDEAWVYGLIRQESRFIGVAKSSAGASGLMQVMPATAKWIAKRLGMADYKPGMITDLDVNMKFGTHYLRYTLDRMDGQVLMATAAYNAGPGRPKRWAGKEPLEGTIYADTIPFSETRDYVKKVMANAYYYAQQMGHRNLPLTERLGIVPTNGGASEDSNSN
jgi:soluble lytic murein transglycosylase